MSATKNYNGFSEGDYVSSRGVCIYKRNHYAIFTRISNPVRSRVWDVVDYCESSEGSHVQTFYDAKTAKRFVGVISEE